MTVYPSVWLYAPLETITTDDENDDDNGDDDDDDDNDFCILLSLYSDELRLVKNKS